MCLNKKRFYNNWLHSWQWVDCGKCSACRQAKANARTRRIRNAVYDGYITLFVTLTYRNINIPYIRKDEIKENSEYINIYRDCSVRRVRFTSNYDMAYKYYRKTVKIGQLDCHELRLFPDSEDIRRLRKLRGQSDNSKVGVCYYKDVQDFEKRLRINLQRRYGITKPIYSFKCSEYGPSTERPHFHLLISIPEESLVQLQLAITEAWPYDSRIKSGQSIEIARDAASYVSSYVNSGSNFPKFLDIKSLRPKHSFSLGYGRSAVAFTLPEILKAYGRSDLRYVPSRVGKLSSPCPVLLPKYACNYYFGKCYGYSRFSASEITELCTDPEAFLTYSSCLPDIFLSKDINPFTGCYDYDFDKINFTIRLIKRLRSRFCRDFEYFDELGSKHIGLPENYFSYELFSHYYYGFWRMYHSNIIKFQYEGIDTCDIPYLFENYDEVYSLGIRSDILSLITPVSQSLIDYGRGRVDLFPREVNKNFDLTYKYSTHFKRRKITNRVMAENGFNV